MIALDFTGKTALVVGGSTGIGNAAAQLFREAGATVHVTGTRASPADYAGTDGDFTGSFGKLRGDAKFARRAQHKHLATIVRRHPRNEPFSEHVW